MGQGGQFCLGYCPPRALQFRFAVSFYRSRRAAKALLRQAAERASCSTPSSTIALGQSCLVRRLPSLLLLKFLIAGVFARETELAKRGPQPPPPYGAYGARQEHHGTLLPMMALVDEGSELICPQERTIGGAARIIWGNSRGEME